VSRRASLPGAEELFRRTSTDRSRGQQDKPDAVSRQVANSASLQVADQSPPGAKRPPKHDEKITFYCTAADLMALERARLKLRADHGISADRGRIVRAALSYVLEDFEARADDSILVRRLHG
jgi:hypothetical protein